VGVGGWVGRHLMGWVSFVRSYDIGYCYCCGECSVGSWRLYDLLVVFGIGVVVVGIVVCERRVVALVGAGTSACSTHFGGVVGVGVGLMVVWVW
jgi:hypothetical protein